MSATMVLLGPNLFARTVSPYRLECVDVPFVQPAETQIRVADATEGVQQT